MSWRRCAVGAVGGFGGLAMCVDVAHADSPLDMVQASNSDPNRFGHAYRRGTSAQEFPDLKGHNSYLAAFLTPDMYAALEKKRTARGSSIDSVIQAGVDVVGNPHTPHVGVYAGDEESYYTFSGLFHPIISAKHKYDPKTMFIPDTNPQKLSNASLNPQYILEVKTKTSRNFSDHRYSPLIGRAERREIEFMVLQALKYLSTNLKGSYHRLSQMSVQDQETFASNGLGFAKPKGAMLQAAGCLRDWPDARGFYMNSHHNLLVWINEQDHMKIVSIAKGGDVPSAFGRLSIAVSDIELGMRHIAKTFALHRNFGYLGPSLANIGTAYQISVIAKFPHLSAHPDFHNFLHKHNLTSPTKVIGGTTEIFSTRKIGPTEVEITQGMIDTMHMAIEFEKQLEKGNTIKLMM